MLHQAAKLYNVKIYVLQFSCWRSFILIALAYRIVQLCHKRRIK